MRLHWRKFLTEAVFTLAEVVG